MHLAVTSELAKRHTFKDLDRLKFGAVLPDAGENKKGHIGKKVCGNNKHVYNFEFYREKYGELMKSDDLYLGYYLHLVQDIVYRHFVYDKHHWNPLIPGNVEKLHKDYSILNSYVVDKYKLTNDLKKPDNFDKEAINDICFFNTDWLIDSMNQYFVKAEDDDIFFFTKEMADEFIAEAVDACMQELDALEKDKGMINSYDVAWASRPYSLLETTLNTRELGDYRIEGTDKYTQNRRIFRSDVANYPSEKDIAFLRNIGITTIIDMRSPEEKERKPHGLKNVEGFFYHDIPIEEGSGIPENVEAVPDSYVGIAHADNIGKVFQTMADAPKGIMYNCSAGKDRSGTITALIMWLCGVSKKDIVFDYMRTKDNNKERFEQIHANFPEIDMNIVIPNENNMIRFLQMMEDKYGAAQNYFTAIGIDTETQQKLKNKLL